MLTFVFVGSKKENRTPNGNPIEAESSTNRASQIVPQDYVPDDTPDKLLWYYLSDEFKGPYYAVANGRQCGIYTDW